MVPGYKPFLLHRSTYILKPTEFHLASFMSLGIPLLFTKILKQCDCGVQLDEYRYHLLINLVVGLFGSIFNTIVSTRSSCLDELNIPHEVEPRNRYADSEYRLDIVAFGSSDCSSTELDIYQWLIRIAVTH